MGVVDGITAILCDAADQLVWVPAARKEKYSYIISQPGKGEILGRPAGGVGGDSSDRVTLQRIGGEDAELNGIGGIRWESGSDSC